MGTIRGPWEKGGPSQIPPSSNTPPPPPGGGKVHPIPMARLVFWLKSGELWQTYCADLILPETRWEWLDSLVQARQCAPIHRRCAEVQKRSRWNGSFGTGTCRLGVRCGAAEGCRCPSAAATLPIVVQNVLCQVRGGCVAGSRRHELIGSGVRYLCNNETPFFFVFFSRFLPPPYPWVGVFFVFFSGF